MNTPRYFSPAAYSPLSVDADLCVYGGVSGGVTAAVEAARRGLNVVLLEPSRHLGGLTASGLGMTDVGNKHVIGGMSREFYRAVGRHYGVKEEWRFEPHVAEATTASMTAAISANGAKPKKPPCVPRSTGSPTCANWRAAA